MKITDLFQENMDHSKDDQAVAELKAALNAHKKELRLASDEEVYQDIDTMMTRIAKSHSMSGQKLHDKWVKKYGQIPDTWIMKESAGQVMLTEAMLREAFLDSVAKYLGDKVKEPVKHVNNMTGALQVLYRVISDPKQLETVTFLLKKRLKLIIKSLPPLANKLKEFLSYAFPNGRGLGDFFKTLLLVAVGRAGAALMVQVKDVGQDAILDPILQAITQIPTMAGTILSGGISMLLNVLQALEIGNALWFDVLNQINLKIAAATTAPPPPQLDLSKKMAENFADGRNPEDKGDSARHGIHKKSSLSSLDKIVHSKSASPRKKQLAHWQANMRRGHKD